MMAAKTEFRLLMSPLTRTIYAGRVKQMGESSAPIRQPCTYQAPVAAMAAASNAAVACVLIISSPATSTTTSQK